MSRFAALWRAMTRWYVSGLFLAGVGIALGYVIFFNLYPGKPQIGIIDVPFTVITDESAFFIGEMLDYTRRTDSIKAVIIRLDSPGGSSFASEHLFQKTLKLRESKPVVIAVQGSAASGGYLWSMGANYIYANPSSIVGSVGARFGGPLPRTLPLDEDLVSTGPSKLASSRRYFVGLLDTVKDAFVATVVSQRGDKLKITPEELSEARIYTGMEGVRLGLIDAIGSDTDAIEKAASLAGISDYDLVDVNIETLRLFVQKSRRIFESSGTEQVPLQVNDMESLGEFLRSLASGVTSDETLPGLPSDLNLPRIYYLYAPPSE